MAQLRTDISGEHIDYIFRETRLWVKNGVFWMLGSCKNRRFEGTSVLITVTRRNIPEDGILHSHRRENLGPYIDLTTIVVQTYQPVT
jgi:hypothetical protein